MKNLYQLVSFVNAYNKKAGKWENLRSVTKVYVGKEGIKSAYFDFENEKKHVDFYLQQKCSNKYREFRGKVEVMSPHIHQNGELAYYGDKIFHSYNPENI